MAQDWLNPFRSTGRPALAGAVLGLFAVAGGRYLLPLAVFPGFVFCVLGAKIACAPANADEYLVTRRVTRWRGRPMSLSLSRQTAAGAVIIVGVVFLCLAAAGIAGI
jgi:hypothetical protein